MKRNYDLVIIGSGSASTSAAFFCSSSGLKTAVVDSRPFGGTCALRGCDPKKVLYGAVKSLDSARRMDGKGIVSPSGRISWNDLVEFKRTFTEPMPDAITASMKDAGIDVFRGRASFTGKKDLKVDDDILIAGKVLIATGARPIDTGIEGSEHMIDSEAFMDMESLPEDIIFIGGGYISVEFAGIAAGAGSRSTIIHRGARILKGFDQDMAESVQASLTESGIVVRTKHTVKRIEKKGRRFRVHALGPDGDVTLEADLVVHGAGRVPDLDGLNLDAAGIQYDSGGIKVNDFMQSVSNSDVYAAGDCASTPGYKLTPVSNIEGEAAGYNIVSGNSRKPDYTGIPTVVFSLPPLAMAGMTEHEAEQSGIEYEVKAGDSSSWYNSRRKGYNNTRYKVIVEKGTSRILGAHIFADNAEETINIFSVAMRHGITGDELARFPFAYPSDTTELRYML